MSKATAIAHPNLAFLKYWGKRDSTLNIPINNSISMNLDAVQTVTTVEFDAALTNDEVVVLEQGGSSRARFDQRVSRHLDRLRSLAESALPARVITRNSFPAGTGFASSASGFAALTLAGAAALGLKLSERELSILARMGSGSASRSIPDGIVEWLAGDSSDTSYARQLVPPDYWALVDIAVIVSREEKKVSSSEGHELAVNSPFWPVRLETLPGKYARMSQAIRERDFSTFGRELESEAMMMHTIMMTSAHIDGESWRSGIYYWTGDTLTLVQAVQEWRAQGLQVYFTLDAGPTVHLICLEAESDTVLSAVRALAEQSGRAHWSLTVNRPGMGARLTEAHLPTP